MSRALLLSLTLLLVSSLPLAAADFDLETQVDSVLPQMQELYRDLHAHPELSFQEQATAGKLAARLRELGFEVTEGVGRTGLVALLKNGDGPTVMLRTDLDALPVRENTGLAYASSATATDPKGETVPVMHACGHDFHMAAWMGAATILASHKDRWQGTLMLVGQPAEELGQGARAMLKDGLFTRFPKPDYAFAIHDQADEPAGIVGYTPGWALANADSVDIMIYGEGGHGSAPETTIDPIVIAARTILALQTIVSREIAPRDPAVISVGSIRGGFKHNIIPDSVHLELTVRSYTDEVRDHLLKAIERVARAEAEAAAAPRPPEVKVAEGTRATYNDPKLTERLAGALKRALGAERVRQQEPVMGAEDFSEYGRAGVPAVMLRVGAVPEEKYRVAQEKAGPGGVLSLPSLHSSLWAPDTDLALRTAIATEVVGVMELMGKK